MRYLILVSTTLLLTTFLHTSWAAPGVSHPRKPITHSKPKPHQCVKKYDAKDRSLVFLLNQCEELLYVSVLEYMDEMPQKTCAVFGLQAVGYGKAYAPQERFMEDTLKVSRNASKRDGVIHKPAQCKSRFSYTQCLFTR